MLIVDTLLPIFLLISLGYFFKRIRFPDENFWTQLDRFNYFVLFPSLLFYKISTSDIKSIVSYDFIMMTIFVIFLLSLILIVLNKILHFDGSSFTSIYQGVARFNVYIFISLGSALLSDESLVLGLILITFIIPFINIMCISIFTLYVPKDKISIVSFFKSVITNPLIIACIAGAVFSVFDIVLPNVIDKTLSLFTMAVLPLGLLSVGFGLHLKAIKENKLAIFIGIIGKLILFPTLMYILCSILSVEKDLMVLLMLFSSVPTASSSYSLARQLGGNLKLMSSLISIQVVLSIFTISFFIWFINP